MALVRFLPLIVPAISFGLLETYFFFPKLFYVSLLFILLLFFFTLYLFIKKSFSKERWVIFFILPSCFTCSLNAFVLLIPNNLIIQILFVFNTIFLYFYFRTFYYHLFRTDKYKDYVFENLSSYGNFLTFYFISSSIYGLQAYVSISVWVLMLVLLFFSSMVIYQLFWAFSIKSRQGLIFIPLLCLILTELAWSASFLTLSYYVLGLILTICYYILVGVTRFYLTDKLDNKIVKLYLFYGLISIFVVLLTARWF